MCIRDSYGSLYTDVQLRQMKEQKPLPPFQEFCGYGIFIAVVIAILFSEKLPATIPTWMICFIGAVLTIVTGVLSEKEAMEALNMPPIFLYIGSLAVGNALVAVSYTHLDASGRHSDIKFSFKPYIFRLKCSVKRFFLFQIHMFLPFAPDSLLIFPVCMNIPASANCIFI